MTDSRAKGRFMTDPATQAARRAFGWLWPDQGDFEFNLPTGQRAWAILAAEEALKPIRAHHLRRDIYLWATTFCREHDHDVTNDTESGDDICLTCTREDGGPYKACSGCFDEDGSDIDWPCETAKLLYPEEEL